MSHVRHVLHVFHVANVSYVPFGNLYLKGMWVDVSCLYVFHESHVSPMSQYFMFNDCHVCLLCLNSLLVLCL